MHLTVSIGFCCGLSPVRAIAAAILGLGDSRNPSTWRRCCRYAAKLGVRSLVVVQVGVAPTPQGRVGILGLCRAKQAAEKGVLSTKKRPNPQMVKRGINDLWIPRRAI
jgi:hypothetical protein